MTNTQNLTSLNRDALRKIAAELKIPGRGNMLKPELIAAIEKARAPERIPGTPLTTTQREENYQRQNRSPRLTARQARRLGKKGNRALARGAR